MLGWTSQIILWWMCNNYSVPLKFLIAFFRWVLSKEIISETSWDVKVAPLLLSYLISVGSNPNITDSFEHTWIETIFEWVQTWIPHLVQNSLKFVVFEFDWTLIEYKNKRRATFTTKNPELGIHEIGFDPTLKTQLITLKFTTKFRGSELI